MLLLLGTNALGTEYSKVIAWALPLAYYAIGSRCTPQ